MVRECRPPAREPSRSWLARRSTIGDVDPRQCQLARQHQPGRAASGDHHRMSVRRQHTHFAPPISASSGFGQRFCGMTRVSRKPPGAL